MITSQVTRVFSFLTARPSEAKQAIMASALLAVVASTADLLLPTTYPCGLLYIPAMILVAPYTNTTTRWIIALLFAFYTELLGGGRLELERLHVLLFGHVVMWCVTFRYVLHSSHKCVFIERDASTLRTQLEGSFSALTLLVSLLPNPVLIVANPTFEIHTANQEAKKYFGEDVVGQQLTKVLPTLTDAELKVLKSNPNLHLPCSSTKDVTFKAQVIPLKKERCTHLVVNLTPAMEHDVPKFTATELRALQLLWLRMSQKEIATAMRSTEQAIRATFQRIYHKSRLESHTAVALSRFIMDRPHLRAKLESNPHSNECD